MVAHGLEPLIHGMVYREVFFVCYGGTALLMAALALALRCLMLSNVATGRRRRSTKDKEDKEAPAGCFGPGLAATLIIGVVSFLLFFILSTMGLGNDSWGWRLGLLAGCWVLLAIVLWIRPYGALAMRMRTALPIAAALYAALAAMHLSMWDLAPPAASAFLAFLCLASVGVPSACAPLHPSSTHSWTDESMLRAIPRALGRCCERCRSGAAERPKRAAAVLAGCAAVASICVLFTCHTCLNFYGRDEATVSVGPAGFSTWASRALGSSSPGCPLVDGGPCRVYLTLPANVSESMVVNAHAARGELDLVVLFGQADGGISGSWEAAAQMRSWALGGLEPRAARDVHSVLLTGLSPSTKYFFSIRATSAAGAVNTTRSRAFYTGPANDEEFSFAVGGDSGNSREARLTMGAVGAARTTAGAPLFAVVGGDVAYDNGMRSCWRCWDRWLDAYLEATSAEMPDDLMLPLLISMGNHDAGCNAGSAAFEHRHVTDDADPLIPLVTHYFPSAEVAPSERLSYSSHVVGNSTLLLNLDSGYLASMDGPQLAWLSETLRAQAARPFRMAVYHVPIYPWHPTDAAETPDTPQVPEGRALWAPLFDEHGLGAAFENHVHSFKRTKPLRDSQPHPNGTVYVGDGYWGVSDWSGAAQTALSDDPHPLVAKGGLRHHAWHAHVRASEARLDLSAVASVSCDELGEAEVCNGVFDSTTVWAKPNNV